jgi:hypothetical protein
LQLNTSGGKFWGLVGARVPNGKSLESKVRRLENDQVEMQQALARLHDDVAVDENPQDTFHNGEACASLSSVVFED